MKWYLALPLAGLLFYSVAELGYRIELSQEKIVGPLRFYMLSLGGIYVCLCLAKLILWIPGIKQYFAFIGKYSFDIMALHFLVIKLTDVVYAAVVGETDRMVFSKFVFAYPKLVPLYLVLGTVLPATVGFLCMKLKQWLREFLEKKKASFEKSTERNAEYRQTEEKTAEAK